MTSPILHTPGAVAPPDGAGHLPDAGVPWHFGDPFAEQRTATRGVAVLDRSNRTVLRVGGEERLSWLHSLLSQHVAELPDGAGTETLVLDGQGRVDLHATLAHLDGAVWLTTDRGASAHGAIGGTQTLLDYLTAMRFWSKVEPTDVTAELATLTVLGPDTPELAARLGLTVPASPYGVAPLPAGGPASGGGLAVRMPWPGVNALDLLVPRDELATWWVRLTDGGARPAGSWAFEALRVEALRPRVGLDTDERTIPHEVNWIDTAVHLDKGCYRGQETVARVQNLGRPPRRMVLLHLDGSPDVLPDIGDPLRAGERTIGRVGTVARHHELGPIALALVKRSALGQGQLPAPLVAGVNDREVAAAIDPDSVPQEGTEPPGRQAVQQLRR